MACRYKNINVSQNTVLFNNSAYSTKDNVFGLRLENSTNATINANTINANNIPYVQNVIILDKSKGVNIASNTLTGAKSTVSTLLHHQQAYLQIPFPAIKKTVFSAIKIPQ